MALLNQWIRIMLRINQFVLGIALVAAIAFLWSNIQASLSQKAFAVPGAVRIDQQQIGKLLDQIAPDGRLQKGAQAEIALLYRNSGKPIRFVVVEGWFSKSSIEPESTWSSVLGKPSMLVSSADEKLSNDGGISFEIGRGCLLEQLQIEMATGRTKIDDCRGSYKTAFPELKYVASAIILAWNAVPEKRNCNAGGRGLSSDQAGYVLCIQSAIESALGSLFAGADISEVDVLVLPELGTGTGRVSKGESYSAETKSIFNCLKAPKCSDNLPGTIVFSVWAGDTHWPDTKRALARTVSDLGVQWEGIYAPTSPVQKQARFIGILLLILLGLIAHSFRNILPKPLASEVPTLNSASIWLVALGWFLAAAGAFSVLAEFIDFPVAANGQHVFRDLMSNVALGALAGGACLIIREANELFKKINEASKAGGSGVPAGIESSGDQMG